MAEASEVRVGSRWVYERPEYYAGPFHLRHGELCVVRCIVMSPPHVRPGQFFVQSVGDPERTGFCDDRNLKPPPDINPPQDHASLFLVLSDIAEESGHYDMAQAARRAA